MPSQCNLIRIQVYTCIPLMAVIVLPVAVQSVPITTNAARSNPFEPLICNWEKISSIVYSQKVWLWLWCLTTASSKFQVYRGGQFYCGLIYIYRAKLKIYVIYLYFCLTKTKRLCNHNKEVIIILSHSLNFLNSALQLHIYFPKIYFQIP
jgi:hypothetical protein